MRGRWFIGGICVQRSADLAQIIKQVAQHIGIARSLHAGVGERFAQLGERLLLEGDTHFQLDQALFQYLFARRKG